MSTAYPVSPPPTTRKKRRWPWVLLAVFVLIIGGFTACTALVGTAVNKIDESAKKQVTVTYSVTGQGSASITYDTSTGAGVSSENANNTPLPWSKDVVISGLLKTPNLIATLGADGGTVTCEISVNGQMLKTATSSGPFASATCMADLPNG
jgi:uncharacterized membrane protein